MHSAENLDELWGDTIRTDPYGPTASFGEDLVLLNKFVIQVVSFRIFGNISYVGMSYTVLCGAVVILTATVCDTWTTY